MGNKNILTSAVILLAETTTPNKYLFGAYDDNGKATSFLHLPEDHQRFVDILTDRQTIMGSNTLEATPGDFPDAGRVCISHHPKQVRADAIAAKSISAGIELAKARAQKNNDDRVYVIGGASIIRQAIENELLDEIELTVAYNHIKGDYRPIFLDFTIEDWGVKKDSGLLISKEAEPKALKYRYLTLRKRQQ